MNENRYESDINSNVENTKQSRKTILTVYNGDRYKSCIYKNILAKFTFYDKNQKQYNTNIPLDFYFSTFGYLYHINNINDILDTFLKSHNISIINLDKINIKYKIKDIKFNIEESADKLIVNHEMPLGLIFQSSYLCNNNLIVSKNIKRISGDKTLVINNKDEIINKFKKNHIYNNIIINGHNYELSYKDIKSSYYNICEYYQYFYNTDKIRIVYNIKKNSIEYNNQELIINNSISWIKQLANKKITIITIIIIVSFIVIGVIIGKYVK